MVFGINVFQTAVRMGGVENGETTITPDTYLDSIQSIADLGFHHVEILTDPLLVALDEDALAGLMNRVASVASQRALTFSVHAPFWWNDIATPSEDMRQASVAVIAKIIDITRPVNPTHFVVHALSAMVPAMIGRSKATERIKAGAFDRYLESAERSVNEIAGHLDDRRQLCVENLQHDVGHRWIPDLAAKTDTSICFDSGHSYLQSLDVSEALESCFPRMRSVHAHNVLLKKTGSGSDCRMEDHHSLRTGLIDNGRLISDLSSRGFNGHFVVEVLSHDDAIDSCSYLKELKLL